MPNAPPPRPFVQSGDELNDFLRTFWRRQIDTAEQETPDYRHPALPLARIKKVMKNDPEVKQMIAADAPILFCKACEIFIAEITARAFIQADSCKRRTLSRQDIVRALTKSDQFDFLIDIVPREEPLGGGGAGGSKKNAAGASSGGGAAGGASVVGTEAAEVQSVLDRPPMASASSSSLGIHSSSSSRPGTAGGPGVPVPGDQVSPQVMLDQLQSLLQQPGGVHPHGGHSHSL